MIAAPSTETHTDDQAFGHGRRGPIPAPLATTASMTTWGSLIWLGPLWAVVFVGGAVALSAVARWGSMDESLWMQVAAGWQRWPVGAVGFTMTAVFLPMFVTNGVTRRRLGHSALVTMGVVSLLGSIVITAGFALEAVVFDAEGWTHVVTRDGGRVAADVGYPTIFAAFAVVNAAYFAAGWLAGTSLNRLGWVLFVPFLVLALVPALVTDVLMLSPLGITQFGLFDDPDAPTLWVSVPLALAVVAATTWVAARWARSATVH
jgi:hypothetical protein